MTEPDTGGAVVWTGRGAEGLPRGRDGWNTSPEQLASVLEEARELVIADPLSFPWRSLPSERRDLPMTVTLPRELDTDDLLAALGRPLLRHLTRFDRLVDDRAEVRDRLTDALGLPAAVWHDPGDDEGCRREGKARLYEAVGAVRDVTRELVSSLAAAEERPLVGFLDRARELAGPVAASLGVEHAGYSLGPDPEATAPHVLVAWLADGDQSPDERRAVLGRARDLLHPGGRLVVLGYVVTLPGAGPNPSVSVLVEELGEVFGAMVHVDELRSVRWRGERFTRGVVLGATSLRGGVI